MQRVRDLAATGKNVTEIGRALGCTHQYVQHLLNAMPDGQHVRDLMRKNKDSAREARRAAQKPPPAPPFVPSGEEIARFKLAVMMARRFRGTSDTDDPVWKAREQRDQILVAWHEKRVPLREVARFGDVSEDAVKLWHGRLIREGRMPRMDRASGRRDHKENEPV
jgi:hypothetical protein